MSAPHKRLAIAHKLPPIVLKEIYDLRFDEKDRAAKDAIWRELGRFFQRYIKPDARVIDIACFLPYAPKGRLPQGPAFVRAYLAFPPAWLLFGKQTLYVGEKPSVE